MVPTDLSHVRNRALRLVLAAACLSTLARAATDGAAPEASARVLDADLLPGTGTVQEATGAPDGAVQLQRLLAPPDRTRTLDDAIEDRPKGDAGAGDAAAVDAASARDAGFVEAASPLDAGRADAADGGARLPAEPPPVVIPMKDAPPETDPAEATDLVLRAIVGLALVVFLAYLGAHPRIRRLEERLGIAHLITFGFPFVALGVVARQLGAFTSETIGRMTPLLQFGLGWIGFLVGFRFDVRFLERVPPGTGLAVFLATALPCAAIAATSAGAMWLFGETELRLLVRDAIALGVAGAMTAPRVGARPLAGTAEPSDDLPRRIGQIDEIAGVVGLAFLSSYFRPMDAAVVWPLTGTAWLFITLGMGVAIGLVLYAAMNLRVSGAEFVAVALGSVAFAAGMAGLVHLSPVALCFVVGALATNLPLARKAELGALLTLLERPIWLLFLTLVGALWDPSDWRGWALVPLFLFARFAGKGVAVLSMRSTLGALPIDREHRIVFSRLSVVSIAIVISIQALYHGGTIPWIVTAVIGAAAISEVVVQLRRREEAS